MEIHNDFTKMVLRCGWSGVINISGLLWRNSWEFLKIFQLCDDINQKWFLNTAELSSFQTGQRMTLSVSVLREESNGSCDITGRLLLHGCCSTFQYEEETLHLDKSGWHPASPLTPSRKTRADRNSLSQAAKKCAKWDVSSLERSDKVTSPFLMLSSRFSSMNMREIKVYFFAKLNWIYLDQIKPILCLYIKYEPACLAPSKANKVHPMAPPKLIK